MRGGHLLKQPARHSKLPNALKIPQLFEYIPKHHLRGPNARAPKASEQSVGLPYGKPLYKFP